MFLILRRIGSGVPRRTVVAAGTGVTDISASVHAPLAAAGTFPSAVPSCVPSPSPPGSAPAPADGFAPAPADGLVPAPLAVRSPGSGSDGLPAPGPGSVKDGSSSGVFDAEGGVSGACEEA